MAQAELSCHEPAAWWGLGLAGFGPGWPTGSAPTLCGAQDPQPSNQNPTDTTMGYKSLEGCSGTLRTCGCGFTALEVHQSCLRTPEPCNHPHMGGSLGNGTPVQLGGTVWLSITHCTALHLWHQLGPEPPSQTQRENGGGGDAYRGCA